MIMKHVMCYNKKICMLNFCFPKGKLSQFFRMPLCVRNINHEQMCVGFVFRGNLFTRASSQVELPQEITKSKHVPERCKCSADAIFRAAQWRAL